MDRCFGDDRNYYSTPNMPERENGYTNLERMVFDILQTEQTDTKHRVEQACKKANLIIREYLRSETALKLTQAERKQTVPYQVADGIPRPLADGLIYLPHDPIFLFLLRNKQLLKNGQSALNLVKNNFREILEFLKITDNSEESALICSIQFFNEILNEIDTFKLDEIIKGIDEDILGAYFFNVPKIEIYWMPIALVSGLLDVSVEDLTFVVLSHELAHAYTHLGLDIDGAQWDTRDFANTSNMIVEGLAQFYTESICRKYENSNPSLLKTFNKLLTIQGVPYNDFKNWTKVHPAEVIRFTMISTRSNSIKEYERFYKEMTAIAENIGDQTYFRMIQ